MSNEMQTFNFEITSLNQAMDYAKLIADSDLAPKDYKGKPGNVLIAIQYGVEIGLKPLQAIQNIAIINGRPCVWGDAMIALVMNHPFCEYIKEEFKNDTAYCIVKRRGDDQEHIGKFSKNDAKIAGLLSKPGPWSQYPERMLQMRARGFALRDKFADVLKGIALAEEVLDYEEKLDNKSRVSVATTKITQLIEGKSVRAISVDDVTNQINNAKNIEELNAIAETIKKLSPEDKEKLRTIFKEKKESFKEEHINVETGEIEEVKPVELDTFNEYEKIKKALLAAKSRDTLDLSADLISSCPEEHQAELREIYSKRRDEVK